MPWTWDLLRPALEKLELPDGQYVVGLSGALLANESLEVVDEVELLVTDDLYEDLERWGWIRDQGHGGLVCPSEDDLFVRAGDVGDAYRATIAELVREAWHQDGIPLVSMVQVEPRSAQAVVDGTTTGVADDHARYLAWTWERVRATLTDLDLPDGEYVVGLSGAMLANESVEAAEEVVLLVTDALYEQLAQRGWVPDENYGLECPTDADLFVRTGDVSDTYRAAIPDLVADGWRQDGIPVVSMMQIDPRAVRSFLGR
ncbi:hypothetical protein D0Z08_02245 [Nocardioides immobilis]|uniref:Uncharacterized protein n=1 Tax=Nocardioides immobilis TaxID=2049295 RepID=A0A417Y8B9_9ACTN|nr:hypothetical protein [Nocardioides immobilis]RHW28694.1 hypothetical protein D0Z08_02245 [Nocardioides immobilis]